MYFKSNFYLKLKGDIVLKKVKYYKSDIIASFGIVLAIIFLFSGAWIPYLDGDFNAYAFGLNMSEIARALSNGELFLWNPNIWGGISGIHNFTSPFYPMSLLIAPIFYDTSTGMISYYSVTVFYAIHFIICSLGFYFLCREVNLGIIPSLCSVLLGMPVIGLEYYLQLCWIPIFLLFVVKAIKCKDKLNIYTILAGLGFGMLCLQQLAQGAVEGLVLIGFMWLVWILTEIMHYEKAVTLKNVWEITSRFAVAGLIGVGIASISLFPILEQSPNLLRVAIEGGFVKSDTGVSISEFYAHTSTAESIRQVLDGHLYSVLTSMFVLMGLFSKRSDCKSEKNVLMNYGKTLYVVIVFASTSIITSEYLYYIPFVNRLREMSLYSQLFPFSITVLVAYGMETLFLFQKKKGVVYNQYLMIILCFVLVFHAFLPISATHRGAVSAFVLLLFIASLFGMYKKLRDKERNMVSFVMALILCAINVYYVKESVYTKSYTMISANEKYEAVSQTYQKIFFPKGETKTNNPYRIMVWGGEQKFSDNAAANCGGYSTEGYWEPIYHKTLESHWNLDITKKLVLNNVKYFIVSENEEKSYMDWINEILLNDNFELYDKVDNVYPSYDSQEGQTLLIYKNINYVGEAWMCYDYEEYTNDMTMEDLMIRIGQKDFNPAEKVLVNINNPAIQEDLKKISKKDNAFSIKMKKYTNNIISLECNTSENGILVLAESDADGWRAYVDGRKVDILECDGYRKGIFLESGTHEVNLKYEPNSFIIGAGITIITLVFIVIVIIYRLRKFKQILK